jgi:uncharacterized alkaline shock family protein YloU
MASYHEQNKYGRIRIGKGVIESVCARVINDFQGRILVSNSKGRLTQAAAQGAETETGFARARLRGGKLDIKLYLIVQFGVSMNEAARVLVKKIREEFPLQTGIETGLITMIFVGTLSEKLSKRNIIFVDDGELRNITKDE